MSWRLGLGAEVTPEGTWFRVWASKARRVDVVIDGRDPIAMAAEAHGYFSQEVPGVAPGSRYRYRLNGGTTFPDPCARYQPEGPHGPSMVVDPSTYRWHDAEWPGITVKGQVIYELHIGTLTAEDTIDAAIRHLDAIRRVGVTLLDVMPVARMPRAIELGIRWDGVICPGALLRR